MRQEDAILIAGPTASGKSGLALALARRLDGVVVNADSMQVYDGLRIVTARPGDADLALAPHRLYGHVPPDQPYSVGAWSRDAESVLRDIRSTGRLPIVCGGTGLYFRALLGGLDAIPPIPEVVRRHWRGRLAEEGPEALHRHLQALDGQTAARLAPADTQRVLRALEVVEATGRPIGAFQAGQGAPLVDPNRCRRWVLAPDRAVLRERIAQRFDAMLDEGAVEEIAAFRRDWPAAMQGSVGKAIAVAELSAYLDGDLTLDEARERAINRTRQYAKRQETWFRHQLDGGWIRLATASDLDLDRL
ncbi:tRNA (adenosine(37)-N6)-dimethylallyltransferase MiaA [Consotaella aegiceratis]|uniref:tRNA (adenosine(37)-N6)-dimethylallyltransferase MiaA n=1 Tax=Consotaella aegiceratis TaxID=3097961 RepID=UPI002F41E942